MFRSHNRKVRLMLDGPGYELFWIAENAEHVITRAAHHSHQISLLEAERLAEIACFVPKGPYNERMRYQKVVGVAILSAQNLPDQRLPDRNTRTPLQPRNVPRRK